MSAHDIDVRRQLYAISLVDELGPLFALYTLWFDDNGVTTAQISAVFAIWAAVSIVLEVPSGALADRLDRRRLVAIALSLRAVGITIWLLWPTFAGVLAGASLWAVHTALASGAWEALVYDQLGAQGHSRHYAVVMARVTQLSHLGIAAGTLMATALVGAGASIPLLGWITVAMHVVSIGLLLRLPRIRAANDDEDDGALTYAGWWRTLREGSRASLTSSRLAPLVGILALVEGLFVVDEYVPLIGRHRGASDALAPLLVLTVFAGVLIGGELAARRPTLSAKGISLLLVFGAAAMTVALVATSLWTVVFIGAGYATMNVAYVLGEARMQERAPPRARATVASVVGFFSAILNTAAFIAIGLVNARDPATGLRFVPPVLLVVALWVSARFPEATSAGEAGD